ncbi:MAG: hypothetical protein IKR23_00980 [Lachnospiraceae bacterium]|nr:hypothetical protein [Lachnospiraceae bacterium]
MKKAYLLIGLILVLSLSCCGKTQQAPAGSVDPKPAVSQESPVSDQASVSADDPVFYGETAFWIKKGDEISVNLGSLEYYDALDSVCVRNIKTQDEVKLPVSEEFKYTAEEDGAYYVYAVTVDGKCVDLSKTIDAPLKISTDSSGFIGL